MSFYHIYCALCEQAGKKPYQAAREMGFGDSNVTQWRKGSTPRPDNLEKIAEYFNVTDGYLMGFYPEAQLIGIQHEMKSLKKDREKANDEKKVEIDNALSILAESYEDLNLAVRLAPSSITGEGQKEKPTPKDERSSDPDIRRIERARNNMSEKDKKKMMELLELSFEDYFSDDFQDDDSDE